MSFMDYGYVRWECEEIRDPCCDDMPTSIVRIYTPEGFVVAADGREYDSKTREPSNDSCRKVFAISQPHRRLAYALSGTNRLTLRESALADLDILPVIHGAIEELTKSDRVDLEHYAKGLGKALRGLLPKREKDEPTIIYLDGYYRGRAERARLEITHDGQNRPKVYPETLTPGHFNGCGSEKIFNALKFDSDDRIARYRSLSWKVDYNDRTLLHAVEIAQNFIDAQCDNEVRKQIDAEKYLTIGGVGHLCIVRPNGDFEWMFSDTETREWVSRAAPTGSHVP